MSLASASHPLQGCGWGACKCYCAVRFKDSKSSQRPGTETISMKYLTVLADSCCSWTQFLLASLVFACVAEAILKLTDRVDNLRMLQKCLGGRSSNSLEASPELYSIYILLWITCSHTFTSCFRILSNQSVSFNSWLFFYNTLYEQSCSDLGISRIWPIADTDVSIFSSQNLGI